MPKNLHLYHPSNYFHSNLNKSKYLKYFDSMKMNLQFVELLLMLGHNVKVIIYTILWKLLQLDQRDGQRLLNIHKQKKRLIKYLNKKEKSKVESVKKSIFCEEFFLSTIVFRSFVAAFECETHSQPFQR